MSPPSNLSMDDLRKFVDSIEGRVKNAERSIEKIPSTFNENNTTLARIDERIKTLSSDVHSLQESVAKFYVRMEQFLPVKQLVFGFASLVLLSVGAAGLAYIIKK